MPGSNSRKKQSEDHISADEHNRRLKQNLIDKVKARDYDSEQEDETTGKKFSKQISSKAGSKNTTTSSLEMWKNKNRKKAYNPKQS